MPAIEVVVGAIATFLVILGIILRYTLRTGGETPPEPEPDPPAPEPEPEPEPTPDPDEPEPEPEPTPTPDSEPDCDTVDVTPPDGVPTVEVYIFQNDRREQAAEVVAAYAEYALRWGWGHKYAFDVRVDTYSVPDHINNANDWSRYRKDEIPGDKAAKDCNLLIGDNLDGIGAGRTATAGTPHAFDLDPDCVQHRHREEALNTAIHEIGHCLGLNHGHGGRREGAITPMQTTYQQGASWTVHWHDNALSQELDVR